MKFERLNPITNEIASSAQAMQPAQMDAIVARAAAAFPIWSAMGPSARRAVLMKAADGLEARTGAFAEAMMGEIGATIGWAMFNVSLAVNLVREAAAITTQISGEVIPSDKPGCISLALREPVGVVLGIAPWNGPIVLGARDCGSACVREQRDPEGIRDVPPHPFADHRSFSGGRFSGRHGQYRHQRARGRRRRGGSVDRRTCRQAHQLCRFDQSGPDHRQARRLTSEASRARTGWESAVDCARRCRSG